MDLNFLAEEMLVEVNPMNLGTVDADCLSGTFKIYPSLVLYIKSSLGVTELIKGNFRLLLISYPLTVLCFKKAVLIFSSSI